MDESIRLDGSSGLYVLAAVAVPDSRAADVRATLVAGLRRGQRRLHWRHENPTSRLAVCRVVAALGLRSVVVTAPLSPARQERARRRCLIHLLWSLDRLREHEVVVETRRPARDAGDDEIARHAVHAGWISPSFRWAFERPDTEPLLWLPDIVAGAVRADADGDGSWLNVLRDHLGIEPAP